MCLTLLIFAENQNGVFLTFFQPFNTTLVSLNGISLLATHTACKRSLPSLGSQQVQKPGSEVTLHRHADAAPVPQHHGGLVSQRRLQPLQKHPWEPEKLPELHIRFSLPL